MSTNQSYELKKFNGKKVLRRNDLIKSGMGIAGVAKFLGCERTLVKNPSETVGPYGIY